VTQVPDQAGTANTMFTIGPNCDNHYRIFLANSLLSVERKIGAAKSVRATVAYDPARHQFWRIRHDAANGDVVFEAAPAVGVTPGEWTELYREAWNTSRVPPTALMIELKAGVSATQMSAPGKAAFDNFRVASR
jgi:hypothetical protein